jgi:hypothetical protein
MTIGRFKMKYSEQDVPHGDSSHLPNEVAMLQRFPLDSGFRFRYI